MALRRRANIWREDSVSLVSLDWVGPVLKDRRNRRDAADPSVLQGYRRNEAGWFEEWPLDAEGRLSSEIPGLRLIVRGQMLQAQTLEGRVRRIPEEAEADRAARMLENERVHRQLEWYEGR